MSEILKRLLAEGKLRRHKTSPREIADLFGVVERNLADASVEAVSADRRFAIAYEAALELATITLYCNGYETYGAGHHFTTFQALKETMGDVGEGYADYFEMCRGKRQVTSYDRAGEISETDIESLLEEIRAFRGEVLA
jgi:hypothetical protein